MGLPVLVARCADLRKNYAENTAVNLFVEEKQDTLGPRYGSPSAQASTEIGISGHGIMCGGKAELFRLFGGLALLGADALAG